jgi:hypothetical protein
MKRFGVALALALLTAIALAPSTDAATTWTARFTGHGVATIRVGSPDRLSLGLTSYRVGATYTVALRRGSCSKLGALILSTRVTASNTGRLARTITLTSAQTRATKLPLTLRVGTRCAAFTPPVVLGIHFVDGTYPVGTGGIQAGTYRTAGGANCAWARLSVFPPIPSAVLANGAGSGPAVVTIFADDGGFKSSGCGTWVLNAPAAPTATPGDGVWRVGIDIQPGTYQSPGSDACSWARLYGFAGNSQIEIHLGSGPTIVTIAPTDGGFESRKCGTWTLLH